MDLLAPCRSCLQCLPFFHVSPPPPPPRLAAPASSSSPADASGAAPLHPSCASESSPPVPAVQEQDLCPPVKAEEEPVSANCDKDEALGDVHVTATESTEALPVSRIVVAPPESSAPTSGSPLPEDADNNDKASTLPKLPMHGYLPEHSQEHAAHDNKVLPTDRPLDDSQVICEPHTDAAHHHSHDSTSMDDVENPVAGHVTLDGEHYDKTDDISLTPPLEVSQSMSHLDMETTDGDTSDTNGASALLETCCSGPVVIPVDPDDDDDDKATSELVDQAGLHLPGHRRRRDRFRDQFKGIKRQIKQGGLHLQQEGSKHMQTIIENMNKQAQQIEQSGSFFMVPRTNNN